MLTIRVHHYHMPTVRSSRQNPIQPETMKAYVKGIWGSLVFTLEEYSSKWQARTAKQDSTARTTGNVMKCKARGPVEVPSANKTAAISERMHLEWIYPEPYMSSSLNS